MRNKIRLFFQSPHSMGAEAHKAMQIENLPSWAPPPSQGKPKERQIVRRVRKCIKGKIYI